MLESKTHFSSRPAGTVPVRSENKRIAPAENLQIPIEPHSVWGCALEKACVAVRTDCCVSSSPTLQREGFGAADVLFHLPRVSPAEWTGDIDERTEFGAAHGCEKVSLMKRETSPFLEPRRGCPGRFVCRRETHRRSGGSTAFFGGDRGQSQPIPISDSSSEIICRCDSRVIMGILRCHGSRIHRVAGAAIICSFKIRSARD